MHTCNRLPWQLGFTPTISRGMGGATVQSINQTPGYELDGLQANAGRGKITTDLHDITFTVCGYYMTFRIAISVTNAMEDSIACEDKYIA